MKLMKKVNSLSGGKTSSYIAANYPADYDVFALVRTNDKRCLYPDKVIRKFVSDKIGQEFIGTLEMDNIIIAMMELEQFIGREITWVTGETYEDVIAYKKMIPNIKVRYCTTELKLRPIFKWWYHTLNEPFIMRIGYRANEMRRAKTMTEKLNKNGLLEIKETVEKLPSGRNRWKIFEWQKPEFPLISAKNPIFKDDVENFWKDKPVNFGKGYYNNCVGCFHRNALFLKKMYQEHENKMDWFADMEKIGRWKKDVKYSEIKKWNLQSEISFDDFSDCDSGYCGI